MTGAEKRDPRVFASLRQRVAAEYGLLRALDEERDVEAALDEIVRRRGASVHEVHESPRLLQELAGLLTVPETHFLRHPAQFDFLVEIVSERLAAAPMTAKVRIWSAGCATGEEPYSAAIALDSALGSAALARVSILATDVSHAALAKARRGVYSAWSFRGTPAWVTAGYFRDAGRDGMMLLDGPPRRAVEFDQAGLMQRASSMPSESVDVVFFRNVGIYWSSAAVEELFAQIARVLTPGGALLLGPSDPRPSQGFAAARWSGEVDSSILRLATPQSAQPNPPSERPSVSRREPIHDGAASGPSPKRARPRIPGSRAPAEPPRIPRPAPVAPKRTAPEPPSPHRALAEIGLELGDAGALDQAVRVASALIVAEPASARGYLLRGQLELGRARHEEAARDLRSAVFLDPHAFITRYWYACALAAAGATAQADVQLRELERRLTDHASSALLEDGRTQGAELLAAVRTLREGLT